MSGSFSPSTVTDGRVGTPAVRISSLLPILEPMASMAPGGGPTHTSPAPITTRAKSPDSERNPYPGWMASAPEREAASTIRADRR